MVNINYDCVIQSSWIIIYRVAMSCAWDCPYKWRCVQTDHRRIPIKSKNQFQISQGIDIIHTFIMPCRKGTVFEKDQSMVESFEYCQRRPRLTMESTIRSTGFSPCHFLQRSSQSLHHGQCCLLTRLPMSDGIRNGMLWRLFASLWRPRLSRAAFIRSLATLSM